MCREDAMFLSFIFNRNYMNDSLRTNVFVKFQPETIACACIFLAARALQVMKMLSSTTITWKLVCAFGCVFTPNVVIVIHNTVNLIVFAKIPLPSRPYWYLLFGATEEEIKDICITTLRLYSRKKVSFSIQFVFFLTL